MLTICLLIAWNYWVPLAVVNPFSTRNLPFSQYGTDSADFHTFYLAGGSWLSKGNPYTLNGRATQFIYPPTSLPLFGIFAKFDFRTASQLWAVLYFGVLAVALLALAFTLKGDKRYVFVSVAVLLFLTSYPLFILFQLGQIDLLLSGLTVLSLVSQRLKHESVSAFLLSVATLLKGPPALLLIYFVLYRRDLKYLARFALSTIIVVGGSLLIVPVGVYSYWIVNVFPTFSSAYALESNQSITQIVANAHLSQIIPAVILTGYGVFAIFALWAGSKKTGQGVYGVACRYHVPVEYSRNALIRIQVHGLPIRLGHPTISTVNLYTTGTTGKNKILHTGMCWSILAELSIITRLPQLQNITLSPARKLNVNTHPNPNLYEASRSNETSDRIRPENILDDKDNRNVRVNRYPNRVIHIW